MPGLGIHGSISDSVICSYNATMARSIVYILANFCRWILKRTERRVGAERATIPLKSNRMVFFRVRVLMSRSVIMGTRKVLD